MGFCSTLMVGWLSGTRYPGKVDAPDVCEDRMTDLGQPQLYILAPNRSTDGGWNLLRFKTYVRAFHLYSQIMVIPLEGLNKGYMKGVPCTYFTANTMKTHNEQDKKVQPGPVLAFFFVFSLSSSGGETETVRWLIYGNAYWTPQVAMP